jgi:hypothetical protein
MKIKDAKNTSVFVIEEGEVKKVNLYNHVMEFAELTTSPRGVAPKMFIELVEVVFNGEDIVEEYANEYSDIRPEEYETNKDFETAILEEYVRSLDINIQFDRVTLTDFDFHKGYYTLNYYCISEWRVGGSKYSGGSGQWDKCYRTEDEADQALFDTFYNYDFAQCSYRDSVVYSTEEEALENLIIN